MFEVLVAAVGTRQDGAVPFTARVIQVLIASPSDVRDERAVVAEVIHEWNSVNARERGVVLMPLRWETDTRPALGLPPQLWINSQIVDHADVVIGVFWTRLGTPTSDAVSGTVEEIDRAGVAGKPVMLYFSRAPVDPESLDLDEYARLAEFRTRTYPRGLVEKYAGLEEFRSKVSRHLAMQVRDIIKDAAVEPSATLTVRVPTLGLRFANQNGEPLAHDEKVAVRRVACTNRSEIPVIQGVPAPEVIGKGIYISGSQQSPTYLRDLVSWYEKISATVSLRLALVNDGESAVHDLHLDTRFVGEPDGCVMTANPPHRPTARGGMSFTIPDLSGETSTAKLENLGPGRWAFEQEVGVVQVGRTLVWSPTLYWRVDASGSLGVTATVYSSDAPPFVLDSNLDVEVEIVEMTFQEILQQLGETNYPTS